MITSIYRLFMLTFLIGFSGCSFITGVPASPSQMDSKWAEICQFEIVSNLTVTYVNTGLQKRSVTRVCSNSVFLRLTPNEEKENRDDVFALFIKICKSDILLSAKLSTKSRSMGDATKNCSR